FVADYYFFFQAEDGIRDFHVTGVQTCALPICTRRSLLGRSASRQSLVPRGRSRPSRVPTGWSSTATGARCGAPADRRQPRRAREIGRASCREREERMEIEG